MLWTASCFSVISTCRYFCTILNESQIRRAIQEAEKADIVLLLLSYIELSKKLVSQYFPHRCYQPTRNHTTRTAVVSDLDKRKLVQEELADLLPKEVFIVFLLRIEYSHLHSQLQVIVIIVIIEIVSM